jgi:hypothetical protein
MKQKKRFQQGNVSSIGVICKGEVSGLDFGVGIAVLVNEWWSFL